MGMMTVRVSPVDVEGCDNEALEVVRSYVLCGSPAHVGVEQKIEKVTQVGDMSAGERTCAGDARFEHRIVYRSDHAKESNSHLRDQTALRAFEARRGRVLGDLAQGDACGTPSTSPCHQSF